MAAPLIWGHIATVAGTLNNVAPALDFMSSLTQREGQVYRGPHATIAQFGAAPPTFDAQLIGGRYRLAGACRFDEQDALRRVLKLPLGVTDAQLILEAYRKWGADSPRHFLGDFAFAIWDELERQLFCARDQLGIVPLYYWHGAQSFCFSSDIEGLLALPEVEPKLNLRYVKSFLLYNNDFIHPHDWFFEAIFKLPPGHTLKYLEGRVTLSRYWNPADVPPGDLPSDDAYAEGLRELLTEAVRCRLATYPPTGAHLSSGLDSGAVAVLAARLSEKQLKTFSWSQPGDLGSLNLKHDERKEIRELKIKENLEVYYTELTPGGLLASFGDITRIPQVHQELENIVLAQAQSRGLVSLLSGWGGDECVSYSGRAYFTALLLQGRTLELAKQLYLWSKTNGRRVWSRGLGFAVGFAIPEPLRISYRRLQSRPTLPGCLSPEFADALKKVKAYPWRYQLPKSAVKDDQISMLTQGHITQRTEAWAAQGARYGLTYLYPLLDRRVVEFALGAPNHLYFQSGQSRFLMRQATRGILPDSVRLKTLKRDPALEEPERVLMDELLQTGGLYRMVLGREAVLRKSGFLNVPYFLETLRSCRSLTELASHSSHIGDAFWLMSLDDNTHW